MSWEALKVGSSIARFVALEGCAKGMSFYLYGRDVFLIGSALGVQVYLPDPLVLPEHAKVEVEEGSFLLTDLSEGKTFVNGEALDIHVLKEGDHVRIGHEILVFDVREVTQQNLKNIQKDIERMEEQSKWKELGECAVLKVLEGVNKGFIYPLHGKRVFTIGRASQNDIKLVDSKISRTHCKIEVEDDEYVLFDLGSTNGVYVRGEKKEVHSLEDGDHIRLGYTVLEFRKSFKATDQGG